MSEQPNMDVGRIVGLIMENPGLIEQIANLAKRSSSDAEEKPKEEPPVSEAAAIERTEPVASQPTYAPPRERVNRAHLLGALKPYVSQERAKAIDSMISIADILDMMRTR